MIVLSGFATGGARFQTAIDRLGELQRLVQVDIIGALATTQRLDDSDGD